MLRMPFDGDSVLSADFFLQQAESPRYDSVDYVTVQFQQKEKHGYGGPPGNQEGNPIGRGPGLRCSLTENRKMQIDLLSIGQGTRLSIRILTFFSMVWPSIEIVMGEAKGNHCSNLAPVLVSPKVM